MSNVLTNTELLKEYSKALPETDVLKYLEKFKLKDYNLSDIEGILLDRKHTLLDLFVAKHTNSDDTLRKIYDSCDYKTLSNMSTYISHENKALKSICLANSTYFLSDNELIKALTDEVLAEAILLSPNISERTIKLTTNKAADILSSSNDESKKKHWLNVLQKLIQNKSEATFCQINYAPLENSGYVEYLWHLFLVLPCNKNTVTLLWQFVFNSLTESVTIVEHWHHEEYEHKRDIQFDYEYRKNIPALLDKIFSRWKCENDYDNQACSFNNTFALRALLAQKIVADEPFYDFDYKSYFINSDDLALRVGYYRSCEINSHDEFLYFYRKDDLHFLQAIIDGKNKYISEDKNAFEQFDEYCKIIKSKSTNYLHKHFYYSLQGNRISQYEDDLGICLYCMTPMSGILLKDDSYREWHYDLKEKYIYSCEEDQIKLYISRVWGNRPDRELLEHILLKIEHQDMEIKEVREKINKIFSAGKYMLFLLAATVCLSLFLRLLEKFIGL